MARAYGEELDGKGGGVWPKDEAVVVELGEAKTEGGAATHGVEVALAGPVEGERGVVAIEDDDSSGGDEWLHGGGLLDVCANGDEAQPELLRGRTSRAVFMEERGGDGNVFEDGVRGNDLGFHGDRGRNKRDGLNGSGLGGGRGRRGEGGSGRVEVDVAGAFEEVGGEDLVDGEVLGGENSVEAVEREGSLAIEEVRDVSLAEAGLLSEARPGEGIAVDAADELEPKPLVEIGKVHVEFIVAEP